MARGTRSWRDAMGLNYRYEDGVTYYRKAIEVDPKLWSARSKLGINLMRLGQTDEPMKQLEECYQNGYRNEATVNSLRLLDSYKNFVTTKSPDGTMILRFNKKEADALRPYFEEVLSDAMTAYDKKYKMKLPGPVQVEVYPNHEDFAVRTMGMPGLEGALGVTFGEVVAMDSPSSRKPGDFHWGETLRHEMSHVYILTATNHRVPRWFTEGLAVHEETEASIPSGATASRRKWCSRCTTRSCSPWRIWIRDSCGQRIRIRCWCLTSKRERSATTSRTSGAPTSCSILCMRTRSWSRRRE